MSGMMRFKSEADFQAMLKKTHLRIAPMITGKPPAEPAPAVPSKIVPSDREESEIEALFSQQLAMTNLPAPKRDYEYLRGSGHELDFAWPDLMIGVEVQGMAHRIKSKFKTDIKKRARGLLQGWRVLEVGGAEIRDGTAMEWLHQLFELIAKGK